MSALDAIDGLAASEAFVRISRLYDEQLGAATDPIPSDDRRQLLRVAGRLLDLAGACDVFLQACEEHIRASTERPEFAAHLEATLTSDRIPERLKGLVATKGAVQEALTGLASGRAMVAETRRRLMNDRDVLEAGNRPASISDDVSVDAIAGIGAGWIAAGAALLAGAALAPKTAGTSAVAGVAIAGAIIEGAGIGAMVAALSE